MFLCIADNSIVYDFRANRYVTDRERLAQSNTIFDAIEAVSHTRRIRRISLLIHGAPSREIGIQFERNHAGW